MAYSDALLNAVRTARQIAGVPITYRRGATGVALTAIVGQTPVELDEGHGTIVRSQVRDYLISATDLVVGGEPIQPARGDRIEENRGGKTYVYEVMPLGSEGPWRWSGPGRDTYRVHTRQLEP